MPSLSTSCPGSEASPPLSFFRDVGTTPSVSRSEGCEVSSGHLGKMSGLSCWSCWLPSWEDAGVGLGPGPLPSDAGLPGSGEDAGLPQGLGAKVQGAGSCGHPVSLSPEEKHTVSKHRAAGCCPCLPRELPWHWTAHPVLPHTVTSPLAPRQGRAQQLRST